MKHISERKKNQKKFPNVNSFWFAYLGWISCSEETEKIIWKKYVFERATKKKEILRIDMNQIFDFDLVPNEFFILAKTK